MYADNAQFDSVCNHKTDANNYRPVVFRLKKVTTTTTKNILKTIQLRNRYKKRN